MEQTFTPTICKPKVVKEEGKPDSEVAAEYAGTITIKRPTYDERLQLQDAVGVEVHEGDTPATVEARVMAKGRHDFMRALARRLPDFFVRADLTRVADGQRFETLDDMQYDTDMNAAISETCGMLVGKYSAKHPTPPS